MVPYGFAGLAVILLMFCAAAWMLPQETRGSMLRLFLTVGLPPVLWQRVSWPIYRRLRKAHPEYFIGKTISEELKEAVEQQKKEARCKAGIRSGPDAGAGYLSHRGSVWSGKLGTAPDYVPWHVQDEAMLFYEDDDDES